LIDWLLGMASQLPDEVSKVCARAIKEGLNQAVIDKLSAGLIKRAQVCQRLLRAAT
jgi:serine/threonine-protein kinase HipA